MPWSSSWRQRLYLCGGLEQVAGIERGLVYGVEFGRLRVRLVKLMS